MKAMNGCEEDSTLPNRWKIGKYILNRCPLKEITNTGLEYIQAYKFYKNGVLPMLGGWVDQAQTFIEAMGIIESEVCEVEKQIKKEQQK